MILGGEASSLFQSGLVDISGLTGTTPLRAVIK